MKSMINFAHRGASAYCPENTMAAFARALELGATGIETDIQRTKDGVLVCIHDESLQRTAGAARLVVDTDYEAICQLDAGSWFDASFAGERIPTLDQLLALAAESELILNLELKNGAVQYPGMEAEVISAVRQAGLADRVVLSSFNHYSLALCKSLAPDIRTGILYMEGLYRPWEYAATLNADALHAYHYAVLPEWVKEAEEAGIVYHPFTVNEEAGMLRLIEAGVAGIITDYPDRLHKLIQSRR
ncbi:glycerophosphodiester phosphodiesterase [Paenibacillus sp. PAMC21692]|uniref:glycerophosphodiester phosphodiesterase n=1 Tax=Paenibacillus sp. PAMC21692 TaxID=2762320 RepID=UPI00164E1849|nr:glycerophosphodiester phosphodiesterase [Paenibacillus sp. PAMC21692]QNK59347.1 glycerophosphodiester phosphodiesterase [Paenibacillus sp. PAMC21692]